MLSYLRAVIARRRQDREKGASAVEYGLMVAAIAAVIVAVVFALGAVVNDIFTDTCNSVAVNDPNNDCPAANQ